MGQVAIRAKELGKQYRIGERQKYKALRDTLTDTIYSPFRMIRRMLSPSERVAHPADSIWALKDLSFEINQGDVVGVIGRNGAGKTTLLKILSRITEPTEGYVDVYGRVGSLLEVGTGFHPELTGRENVYLNGSIIGMRKGEIDRKFDEIVAFAEVEQFLDTPVKFYSSGMYMRLAFSVAAHLEPEILIVDEALAVGDAAFQKKCLGKMGSVAKEGRTVVLVSHNMPAVRSICKRGIVLEGGRHLFNGPIEECISHYTASFEKQALLPCASFSQPFSVSPWITSATILSSGIPAATLRMGDKLSLVIGFRSVSPIQQPGLGIVISTQEGQPILCASNRFQSSEAYESRVTEGEIYCDFGAVPFMENRYIVSLYLGDSLRDSHFIENALTFEVTEYDCWGQGKVPPRKAAYLWWPTTFSFQ